MGASGAGGQIMSGIGAAANNFNQNNRPVTSGSQQAVGVPSEYADLEDLMKKYFTKSSEIDPNEVSTQGTQVDYNF